jgi:hypothetical protein
MLLHPSDFSLIPYRPPARPQPAANQTNSSHSKHGHDKEKETTRRQAGVGELCPVYTVEAKNAGFAIGDLLLRERVGVTKRRHGEWVFGKALLWRSQRFATMFHTLSRPFLSSCTRQQN